MIKNYLVIAIRNLLKHKVYNILIITGLTVAMTSFMLIIQYVKFEKSYDNYHDNAKNLYRLNAIVLENNKLTDKKANTPPCHGPAYKQAFPEILEYARLSRLWDTITLYKEKKFRGEGYFFADNLFLKMFSIQLIYGDINTALSEPNSIVISETMAHKYFGDDNPIGKVLEIRHNRKSSRFRRNSHSCEVKGIFRDIPENSHADFDGLVSMHNFFLERPEWMHREWLAHYVFNYFLLRPNTNIANLEKKIEDFLKPHKEGFEKRWNYKYTYHLQPVTDIHLNSNLRNELRVNGSSLAVNMLLVISILIMIIVWINFANLSVAKSNQRAKEIGVRKVVGSNRFQLVIQFLLESLIINIIPIIIANALYIIIHPYFCNFVGKSIPFSFSVHQLFILFLLVFIIGSLISGIYPAFIISSFKPYIILKGKNVFNRSSSGISINKILVLLQFIASIILITITFTIFKQMNYLQNKEKGFDIKNTLIIRTPIKQNEDDYKHITSMLKAELSNIHNVSYISYVSNIPSQRIGRISTYSLKRNKDVGVRLPKLEVDYDYLTSFKHTFLSGRNFSENFGMDQDAIILNKSALNKFGFNNARDAVNDIIIDNQNKEWKIIGVIENYHQESAKNEFAPVLIFLKTEPRRGFYCIKYKNIEFQSLIISIQKIWESVFPNNPFEYEFLDDVYNNQYKGDQQFGSVFGLFSIIAIILSCLGLLGLSYYNVAQRTKEIGIRKVMGANINSILYILSKDFIKIIIIANIFAYPIAYFVINKWLSNFAYRIATPWHFFGLTTLLVICIALFTINGHAISAATANPVNALRNE